MKPTMMTYIHQEHEVLSALLEAYPQGLPALKNKKAALILATGSSINAAISAKYYVEQLTGMRLTVAEPFHFHHYESWDPATDLVIGISQSGESTSTIAALEAIRQQHNVQLTGITGEADSSLARTVDEVVTLRHGEERVGYVTKGYVATILTLMLMGLHSAMANGRITALQEADELAMLKRAVAAIPQVIADTETFWLRWQEEWIDAPRFTAIGYGPNVGTIMEMGTKFSETVRVPSQGIELETFMHGPYFEVNPQHRLFFVDVDCPARERLDLLRSYENNITPYVYSLRLGKSDDPRTLAIDLELTERLSPLLLVIPFQILSHHIAEAKGNNLPQRIFTDFGIAMKSKTRPGNYA